jgi:serine protease Do
MNPKDRAGIHLSDAIGRIAAQMREITVQVRGSRGRQGSGTVWPLNGLIITNAHVTDAQVHNVEFADGQRYPGWLVARDPDEDLAALAVSPRPSSPGRIRSASGLRAGELVLATGNPNGDTGAITTGIVHRSVGSSPHLFADIRLAPGYSGGPLADATGAIVAINSMIINGLGCAVTSDAVERFLRRFHLAEAA